MIDVAKHVRVFEKDPSDEFVQKRIAVVAVIVEKFAKLAAVEDILLLAHDIGIALVNADSLPNQRAVDIETIIRNQSTAFVRDGQDLQILTCALLAVLQMISEATSSGGLWSRREVLAVGLWLSLSFQEPRTETRLETLRSEVVETSQQFIHRAAFDARRRQNVPDITVKAKDNAAPPDAAELIKASNKAVEALRTNAALDREELDLLWWALNDWSSLLKMRFSDLPGSPATIASGLEAGTLMRRIPSESHKQLVLRYAKKNPTLTCGQLIESFGDRTARISEGVKPNQMHDSCFAVFPLLRSLRGTLPTGTQAELKFPLKDWGARALLESSLVHLSTLPAALV